MTDPEQKVRKDFESTIAALEKSRKSKIFCVVHTAPPYHVCGQDYGALLKCRDTFKNCETIDVLLHSPGGHADVAYQVARFLRGRCKRLNALVPLQAKSAATLLCLGADSIIMGELAELGPVDVQIGDELEKGKAPFSPLDEFKSMEYLPLR